jgi:hypothetical protein
MKTKSFIPFVLISITFLFAIDSITYAQKTNKNVCKYETDKIDDFTKNRNVRTEPGVLMDKKPSAAEILLEVGGRVMFNVVACNNNGINSIEFDWVATNENAVRPFNQVDLLFENGDVINFMDEKESELLNKYPWIFSYKLFEINNDSIWYKLKTSPVKKFKISINTKELSSNEIDNKYSESVMKVINCIDNLNIEKRKPLEMTSDEALLELKRAKDKLDLEIINQEKYDSLKAVYIKYIK